MFVLRSYLADNPPLPSLRLSSAEECLNLHSGPPQTANLGDGRGRVNQSLELRENFPLFGTCLESVRGGNHLRMWRQENTNALFLAYVNSRSPPLGVSDFVCICESVFPWKM